MVNRLVTGTRPIDLKDTRALLSTEMQFEKNQCRTAEMMFNESQSSKYIIEFFDSAKMGAKPTDSMRLMAENEPDAIAQADWLARHTSCHHLHVRAVERGAHSVIYKSSDLARAA